MKKVIIKLFHFNLMQQRWSRRWMGGTYFKIDASQLNVAPFWSDKIITSCQAKILEIESYLKKK